MPTTILVVEDNPLTRKVVRAAFQSEGYDVLEAEDGASALAIMADHQPALILQDLFLPDMDGLELGRSLRALCAAREVPIIALYALPSKLAEAGSLGTVFTDWIAKPIEPSKLVAIARAYTGPAAPAQASPGRGRRVLVVEDDPIQRKLLRIHLEQLGFSVIAAADGIDGLERARASLPDAIVSDMLMPGLDGFRFCVVVRQEPALRNTPIVLTSSAFVEEEDRRLAEGAGADAFVVRTPDLGNVIQALLTRLDGEAASRVEPAPHLPPAEYADRVARQLVRQAGLREDAARRLVLLEERLQILAGLSGVLGRQAPTEVLLDELLHRALEAAGVPRAAAYLLAPNGALRPRAVLGLADVGSDAFEQLFGGSKPLNAWIRRGEPLQVPSAATSREAAERLLAQFGASSLLAMPLVSADEPIGALVVGWASPEDEDESAPVVASIAGQVGQAIALARALSRLREREEEREQLLAAEQEARRSAEAAVRARDEFISVAAHELKTPLTSLRGFAQLVVRQFHKTGRMDPARVVQAMEQVDRQSARLDRLTEHLLNLSQLRAGKLSLHVEETELSALAEGLIRSVQQSHPERTLLLKNAVSHRVAVDPLRIEQVLANLLDNAVKFSPAQSVVEVDLEPDGAGWVVISVRDHGIGIPVEKRGRIFERFYQAHPERHHGGMGLGLHISKQIVEMHGGSMAFEAPSDGGSRFIVRLPISSHQPSDD